MNGANQQQSIAWGILGAGRNSGKFASDFVYVRGGYLHAVASRQLTKAQDFATAHNIPVAYGSYDDLLQDPKVDIVYIGTVNSAHYPLMKMALLAGKPVVCEKPFTLDPTQTREVIDLARSRNLFLMEGLWTRFFPVTRQLSETIASGSLGKPLWAQFDFGFIGNPNPNHRLWDPALGAGAYADVGIYPLTMARHYLGKITHFDTLCHRNERGVDTRDVIQCVHESGAYSVLSTSIDTVMPCEGHISTEHALIKIHNPCWKPAFATIYRHQNQPGSMPKMQEETIGAEYSGHGFHFEIEHVHECLRRGLLESPLRTLDETLETTEMLYKLRSTNS